MLRRLMLNNRGGGSLTAPKTVIAQNFEPDGQKFYYQIDFDGNADTFYTEIKPISTNLPLQNVLSIGESLNGIAQWKKYSEIVIHCYYPCTLQLTDKIEVDYGYKNSSDIMYHKNVDCAKTIKIALNQYGIWVNGKLIKGNSVNSSSNVTDDTDVFNMLFNQIKQRKTLTVGSFEGNARSFQHYREISILHRLYSAEEITSLTAL